VDLARRNQAKLTVVDVIEEDSWVSGEIYSSGPFRELKQLVSEERQTELDIVIEAQRQQGLDVRSKLLHGKPFLEIVREVLRENHDLVIKTAQKKGGFKGMLFGSTAPVWLALLLETLQKR
jgi:nucleotide-binding universal stress UspA family protein